MSEAGPGSALRDARESIGVTEHEVADALNLPVSTIKAIEANDGKSLPSPVFARGYIRAYAKLLDLDPDPLVAEFRLPDVVVESTPTMVRRSGLNERLTRNKSRLPWMGLVVVLFIGAVVAYFLWPTSKPAPAQQSEERAIARELPPTIFEGTDDQASSLPVSEVDEAQTGVAESQEEPEIFQLAPEDVQDESILERNALEAPHDPDAAAQGAVAGERVRRITAQGSDHLVMKFSEDCWVEINATDGAPLFNDLGHTGQTLRLIGDAPFRILLGYAPGVTMAFNDEAVPLRPHTRNNVATLVVGQ